jgi:hypothetical protein
VCVNFRPPFVCDDDPLFLFDDDRLFLCDDELLFLSDCCFIFAHNRSIVFVNFCLVLLVLSTPNMCAFSLSKGIDFLVGGSGGGVGIVRAPPRLFFRVERILYNIVLYFIIELFKICFEKCFTILCPQCFYQKSNDGRLNAHA